MAAKSFVKEHMAKSLAQHALSQMKVEGPIKAFYLHAHDAALVDGAHIVGRAMSTLLMFSPEGIIVTGDLCPRPCKRGCISDLGYSLEWFAGELGEDYLCSKFLDQGIYASTVEDWLADVRENDEKQEKRKIAEELLDELPVDDYEATSFLYDEAIPRLKEEYDGQGRGYKPTDAAWLCAIQQRFAALYKAGTFSKAT